MAEFVAVNDSMVLFEPASIKRQALMFEPIAVPFVKGIVNAMGLFPEIVYYITDIVCRYPRKIIYTDLDIIKDRFVF